MIHQILIVEDEPRLAEALEKGLHAEGFATTTVADGLQARTTARDQDFDLAILDLGLPAVDGLDVLRALRAAGRTYPVIILTARDETRDKIAGLEVGADDYVTKPFAIDELIARIRVRLRATGTPGEQVLRAGPVTLDLRTRQATCGPHTATVTTRELSLLEIFLRYPGEIQTRERLLERVWGYRHDPGSNIVDVYVRHLRRKLGPDVIETVYGQGYRLSSGD
jgi:DNA-binding response OmpR family regulator